MIAGRGFLMPGSCPVGKRRIGSRTIPVRCAIALENPSWIGVDSREARDTLNKDYRGLPELGYPPPGGGLLRRHGKQLPGCRDKGCAMRTIGCRFLLRLSLFVLCLGLTTAPALAGGPPCEQSDPAVCDGVCFQAGFVCTASPVGPCRCEPDTGDGFPPAGVDLSPTVGLVLVDVIGIGPVELHVSGETLLQFSDPQFDPVSAH